ncbi:MAG: hypothetical protein ACMUIP_01605 [bacterium]
MVRSYQEGVQTTMIKPHGGILINRVIEDDTEIQRILSSGFTHIEITNDVVLEIENIAHGIYSPLTGFPSVADIEAIMENWRLTSGMIFPMAPICHVDETCFQRIRENEEVIFTFKNKPIALMHVQEKSIFDKSRYLKKIFRTTDPDHPGVSYIRKIHENILTGPIKKLGRANYFFTGNALTPSRVRHLIEQRGWKIVTAFSTTNIPHRAHEYLQRVALEISDGIVIHALSYCGAVPKFTRSQIQDCYNALITNYFPEKNILFAFLPTLPRSAGPRSSLMQAIIRQNFGCTQQVFGRDHEGFKDIFQKYESQQVFDTFPEIELKALKLKGPYYCTQCNCIVTEKNCRHTENKIEISGTHLRDMLQRAQEIPEYYCRKEVLDCLKNTDNV